VWRRRFLFVCGLLVIVMVVGAAVSIAAEWPAQFGGQGDPDEVAAEFLSRGTALAPPVAPLLLFAICAALASRRDRWGTTAVVGAMLLSVVFIIGSLGEAFAEPTPDVPRAALITSGVVGALLSSAVLATGGAVLRNRGAPKPARTR
jgi:uncharacterized membrane protein YhaH (DUF805 family)